MKYLKKSFIKCISSNEYLKHSFNSKRNKKSKEIQILKMLEFKFYQPFIPTMCYFEYKNMDKLKLEIA